MKLTCIECPMGCEIEVVMYNGKITAISGNSCLRGEAYAKDEVTCPKRVITTTVRAENGKLVSVKTDAPVKKSDTFKVIKAANSFVAKLPVKIGQVLIERVSDNVNLISSSVMDR